MTNRWIEHVKKYARKHNCSYGEAMKKAKKSYKPVASLGKGIGFSRPKQTRQDRIDEIDERIEDLTGRYQDIYNPDVATQMHMRMDPEAYNLSISSEIEELKQEKDDIRRNKAVAKVARDRLIGQAIDKAAGSAGPDVANIIKSKLPKKFVVKTSKGNKEQLHDWNDYDKRRRRYQR